MPAQDTSELKTNILAVLKQKGPSLPVHIAKETGLSILFSSAFLSELLSERKIKISDMRVGSSPIYYIPGQENQLEKFSMHLGSKEKEAFELLQDKKILKDAEQHPAIRVALRSIKDFAKGFNQDGQVFWKYYLTTETPMPKKLEPKIIEKPKAKEDNNSSIGRVGGTLTIKKPVVVEKSKPEDNNNPNLGGRAISRETITKSNLKNSRPLGHPPLGSEVTSRVDTTSEIKEPKTKDLEIFDKPKKKSKKPSTKNNEKFFNKVKDYLSKNDVEILDIESFNKNELILKVRENEQEILMVAYNKKRIAEEDIVKAHKKIADPNMNYKILSLGEPLKKVNDFIKAIKNLKGIKKINDNL